MTEIIQMNPWLCVIGAAIIGIWAGAAGGLLTSGLCHTAKKGGEK